MDRKAPRRGMNLGGVEYCYCSKCGYKEEHQRGIPCTQRKCPKCRASMMGETCKV